MAVGITLWIIFLVWLMSLLHPSSEMRRDPSGNGVIYTVWGMLFVTALLIQYHIMAYSGHATLAIVTDLIAVSIFAGYELTRWVLVARFRNPRQ